MNKNSKNIYKGLFWKLLERFGVSGIQFILQIILARLLDPAHYGMLSIMIIFTSLANIFIQNGFNTALIQNKDTTEEDFSSVFWVSLGVAGMLYGVIFFSAPVIARFYEMPDLVAPLRVLALMLFPGALNSIQLAKVRREMDFRKVFYSNIGGILVAGGAGIAIALLGGGVWALVVQTLLNTLVACLVMRFTVKLKLRFVCNLSRVKSLFRFGWKLLVSGLINTLYQDLRSLVIGKKYDSATLGYYNRGKQFPHFIINAVNGTVQAVMLPAMSAEQDDKTRVKTMMRRSVTLSAYILFPLMAGLAAVAAPMVSFILTDKWLPCVPYLQIYCLTFAFYPVHSCNLQAINAIGRSDIFLKLEIIKKAYGILALVIAVLCFDSPVAIALTGAITTIISSFVNAAPTKKLINYSYFEQMKDILPAFALSILMLAAIYPITWLNLPNILIILIQVVLGIAVYVLGSVLFRLEAFTYLWSFLKKLMKKAKKA